MTSPLRRLVLPLLALACAPLVASCSAFETNVQDTAIDEKDTARQNYEAAEAAFKAERWQEAGGNGVSVLTQKIGFDSVAAHIDYVAEVKQAIDTRFGS
jgi:hypothetical protein